MPWGSFPSRFYGESGAATGLQMLGTYFLFKGVDIYEPMQKADAIVAAGFPGILFASFQGIPKCFFFFGSAGYLAILLQFTFLEVNLC